MNARLVGGLLAACSILVSQSVLAADPVKAFAEPAAKQDSGLGDLPAYKGGSPEVWVYSQPAAKQDSGLGELTPASVAREVWMHQYPAAKVDSGLGEPQAPARMAARQ